MNFDDVNRAVNEAQDHLSLADSVASRMAGMLRGRLRHVSTRMLAELKKELRDFNARTKEWKK